MQNVEVIFFLHIATRSERGFQMNTDEVTEIENLPVVKYRSGFSGYIPNVRYTFGTVGLSESIGWCSSTSPPALMTFHV